MTDACKARVLKTMKEFPSSVDIQINCCQVLSNIALSGMDQSRLVQGRQACPMIGNDRHDVASSTLQHQKMMYCSARTTSTQSALL